MAIGHIKSTIKVMLAPILYRNVAIGLGHRRFHLWLDALRRTQGMTGAVVEIGVAGGGTTVHSWKYLRMGGDNRRYVGIDTFEGWIEEQFAEDVKLGNRWELNTAFNCPKKLVRKVLDLHGANDVELIQADITKLPASDLPEDISAVLLDVDLAALIHRGLELVWPRMQSGGIIVIDDCYEEDAQRWQALKGLKQFMAEKGLHDVQFYYGAGMLERGSNPDKP